MTTIATTATTSYLRSHVALGALAPLAALTHGFRVGFLVLAGVALVAAVLAAVLIGPAEAVVEGAVPAAVEPATGAGAPARRRLPSRPQPVHVLGLVTGGETGAGSGSYDRLLFAAAREQAPEGMTIDEFDTPPCRITTATAPSRAMKRLRSGGCGPPCGSRPRSSWRRRSTTAASSGALRNAFAWAQRTDDGHRTLAGMPLAVMGPSCDGARHARGAGDTWRG